MSYLSLFTASLFVQTFSQPNEFLPDEMLQFNARFETSSGRVPNFGFDRGDPQVPGYYERMRTNPDQSNPQPDFPEVLPYYLTPDYIDNVNICLDQYPPLAREPNPSGICPAPGFPNDWRCFQTWDICGRSCDDNFICICDLDVHGNNVCWQDDYCSNLQDCSSNSQCGLNQVCVPDTCCRYPYQRTVCLDLCEDPDVPSPTRRPTRETRNPTPETPAPVLPPPTDSPNDCECDIDNYWTCLAWTFPERCGTAKNPQWGCYCVPQIDEPDWNGLVDPQDNSCVENNWCSAAPACVTDNDCPADYECIPNTCCSSWRSRCVRCCENPYNDPPVPAPTNDPIIVETPDPTPHPIPDPTPDPVPDPQSDCPCDYPQTCTTPFNWGDYDAVCGDWWQTIPRPKGQIITWQDVCQCTTEVLSSDDPNNVQDQVCLRGTTNPNIGNLLCSLSKTCTSTTECQDMFGPGYYCTDACCSDDRPRCVPCCEYPFRFN